ncbi:hypothetical protein GCM10020219_000580 [Nonomuraea dietziae]
MTAEGTWKLLRSCGQGSSPCALSALSPSVGGSTCSTASGSGAIQEAVHASWAVSNQDSAELVEPAASQSVTRQVWRVLGRSRGPS